MTRRQLVIWSACVVVLHGIDSFAQTARRPVRHVVFIVPGPDPDNPVDEIRAHFAGLFRNHGLDSGRLSISVVPAGPSASHIEEVTRQVLATKPDVLCITGRVVIEVVTGMVRSVPIVFYNADDPVRDGYVASLRSPGGNATGIANRITQLHAKRIEMFRALRPAATTVAVIYPERVRNSTVLAELRRTLTRVNLKPLEIAGSDALGRDELVAVLRKSGAHAFMSIGHELPPDAWAQLQMDAGVPGLFQSASIARAGGLLAHGPNLKEQDERVVAMATRILGGASPAGMPVEELARPYIVVNLKTAKALGIEVPPAILLQADEILK